MSVTVPVMVMVVVMVMAVTAFAVTVVIVVVVIVVVVVVVVMVVVFFGAHFPRHLAPIFDRDYHHLRSLPKAVAQRDAVGVCAKGDFDCAHKGFLTVPWMMR